MSRYEMEVALKKFKKLYKKAVDRKETQFVYEGQDVLVSYAKYYIEYLEGVLNGKRKSKEAV